jgi:hypothetical protein
MREGLEWFLGVMVGLVGVPGLEEPLFRFEGLHGIACHMGCSTSTCMLCKQCEGREGRKLATPDAICLTGCRRSQYSGLY